MILANEVLDALPTHRVVARGSALREIAVGWEDGAFVDVEIDPSTPALAERLVDEGVTLADGQRAEICLALDTWIAGVAAGLERGVVLLIDYGYPAEALYDPVRRRDGTLRAYLRHRVHDDPYIHVGRQDLTAHVDVTAVERAAVATGLSHLGTTTQAEFLVGLGTEGLLQAIQADPATTLEDYLGVRSALLRLLDPAAMGRFRVMAFGRDWPAGATLAGLDYRLRPPSAGRPHVTAPNPTGIGRLTYCRSRRRGSTIRHGRARPERERRADLHARSARVAPPPPPLGATHTPRRPAHSR